MSTLMSADLIQSRSSTRVFSPPGGKSSIAFGDDNMPQAPSSPRKQAPASTNGGVFPSAPPAPAAKPVAVAVPAAVATTSEGSGGGLKVGLVVVANCAAKAATVDSLAASGASTVVYDVDDTLQSPYAAKALMTHERVASVIVLATGGDPLASQTSGSVISSLIGLGLSMNVPVVTAFSVTSTGLPAQGSKLADAAIKLAKMSRGQYSGAVSGPQGRVAGGSGGGGHAVVPAHGLGEKKASHHAIFQEPKPMPADIDALMEQLRAALKQHGAKGMIGLGRKFRIADDNGNGQLDMAEFTKCMKECKMTWSAQQIQSVFNFFDDGGDGNICYDEFLVGVRGHLNDTRAQLVLAAFAIMDKDKNGHLDLDDVRGRYDPTKHPDVIAGKRTGDSVLQEFLSTFDGDGDGKVTPEEWCKYYAAVSASIDDDVYFELMMRNAWHMSGGTGQAANTTCRRVLATHSDGSQTVEEITNDLGIAFDDRAAMLANLKAQGLDVVSIDIFGSVDTATPAAAAAAARPRPAQGGSGAAPPSPFPTKVRQQVGGKSNLVLG